MRPYRLIALCALFAASRAFAAEPEYTADVQQAYTPSAQVKRLAVAPVGCPPEGLDCKDLQKELQKLLGKRTQLLIVSADETQLMMERAGITRIDFETRYILAEGMRVDAVATLEVKQANVDLIEGEMVKIGQAEVTEGPVKIKHVKLVLEVSGKDGSTLLQASGEGKVQGFKGLDGVAKHTLETMVEQAIPLAE